MTSTCARGSAIRHSLALVPVEHNGEVKLQRLQDKPVPMDRQRIKRGSTPRAAPEKRSGARWVKARFAFRRIARHTRGRRP